MARSESRRSYFRRSFTGILQTIFALVLFAIFVIAWLVQAGSIKLPQWAKALDGVTPEVQATYTAALIPAVLIVALLFFSAGLFMMMKERSENRSRVSTV
ncbi:uncharacterized protein F4822DRAFT_374605 [Hypoxylon trugodes]|uniref:uncharacterized protein n=1 Tax=Hypoxylon trugodes TaxID=326681 RepID=UPI00219A2AF3|nr:uncharacterized protein F4822DRAFT_374605 [Hypoxylon trugodes]KAI1384837.1 hypothetical protein F4822DRAFT_374605 [Hypoxylon trugodes]